MAILNTRPDPSGHHFVDDIFKFIFLAENVYVLTQI